MKSEIQIEKGEYWWGGAVNHGNMFPLSETSEYIADFKVNLTNNQVNGVYVSSHGRYIYTEGDYSVNVQDGRFSVESTEDIEVRDGYGSLREAYLALAGRHFEKGIISDISSLTRPQYCTWMSMFAHPDDGKVLAYADSIIKAGLKPGILIIDDGWMKDFGNWSFSSAFRDPKGMADRLHEMGFKIVMWVCPFVSENAYGLFDRRALLHGSDGKIALREWWDGTDAVLDMTSPYAREAFGKQLDRLVYEYGVDGFKFDAGDPRYYREDDRYYMPSSPNGQSALWALFCENYSYGEMRACVGLGGHKLVQRLCDKRSEWTGGESLESLIHDMIQAGLVGYPYCCPDMVAGGLIGCRNERKGDEDWIIRSFECALLMPMIQFSKDIWNVSPEIRDIILKGLEIREKYIPLLTELFENAGKTGEPVLRCLEYVFPHQGLEEVKDEFMIGDTLLAAPVIKESSEGRKAVLPACASWICCTDGRKYEGGKTIYFECGKDLLFFERV